MNILTNVNMPGYSLGLISTWQAAVTHTLGKTYRDTFYRSCDKDKKVITSY